MDVEYTRDRGTDSISVWDSSRGLRKMRGDWYQLIVGSICEYTGNPMISISKQVFKTLFGYTLPHGHRISGTMEANPKVYCSQEA